MRGAAVSFSFYLSRYLAWMVVFACHRAIFLGLHAGTAPDTPLPDLARTFIHAVRLDSSMAAYLMFPASLAALAGALALARAPQWLDRVERGLLVAVTLVSAADAAIYGEWGVKLGYRALMFLRRPDEVTASAPWSVLVVGVLHIVVMVTLVLFMWPRATGRPAVQAKPQWRLAAAHAAVMVALLPTVARGGVGEIPIHQSDAYFSRSDFANLAAVNPVWNTGHSVWHHARGRRAAAYRPFETAEAERRLAAWHGPSADPGTPILAVTRPNVVLLVLESWSAAFVESLGGEPGITPSFSTLAEQGLLFDHFYSAGTLTPHGLGAILSGLPTTPLPSLVSHADSYERLPSLARDLAGAGYHSVFVFGGELSYGNIKAYLSRSGFERFIERRDFPPDIPSGRLGVHDEHVLPRVLAEAQELDEPFFVVGLTGSSHSPYDHPGARPIRGFGKSDRVLNAVHYSDACLGDFMRTARRESWFARTLFVLVADHPHPAPSGRANSPWESRRIPLLLTGGALNSHQRGARHQGLVAQYDVPALLLRQLGLPHAGYRWSRDPLNPATLPLVCFGLDDGFGWIRPDARGVWRPGRSAAGRPPAPPEALAVLQTVVDQFYR